MNKRVATTAVSAAVAAGMVFGLSACGNDEPSDDFKTACKDAGGEVKRDSEVLGMSSVAFVAGKGGGGGRSGGSGSKGSSSGGGLGGLFGGGSKDKPKSKSPKTNKKNDGWKLADGSKSTSKPKNGKKSKSSDNDDEWVCAKDGVELFDE